MKVNADRISEAFDSNRQEMLRLEETSFLSTGGQIRQTPESMDDVFTIMDAPQSPVSMNGTEADNENVTKNLNDSYNSDLSFHPFNHKYVMLNDNGDTHPLSLYKSFSSSVYSTEAGVTKGLGFEVRHEDKAVFHPFSRKFEINNEKIMKRVF